MAAVIYKSWKDDMGPLIAEYPMSDRAGIFRELNSVNYLFVQDTNRSLNGTHWVHREAASMGFGVVLFIGSSVPATTRDKREMPIFQ